MFTPFPPEKPIKVKPDLSSSVSDSKEIEELKQVLNNLSSKLKSLEELKGRAETWMQTDIRPKYKEFQPEENQKVFLIGEIVSRPELSNLYVNQVRQDFLEAYTIDGSILSWLGFDLDVDDSLVLLYY